MLTRYSIETLLETAPLLGTHALETLAHVRDAQVPSLLPARLVDPRCPAGHAITPRPRPAFYYGSLDFLPLRAQDGREGFQLLEVNGVGSGGLAALPEHVLAELLETASRVPDALDADAPLLLLPVTFGPKVRATHEHILLAQALKEGLARKHGRARIAVFPEREVPEGPAVLVGLPSALRAAVRAEDGRLTLEGRAADAVVRDLFCQWLADRWAFELAPGAFHAVNAIHNECAAKDRTYARYNAFLAERPSPLLRRPVTYRTAATPDELEAVALEELDCGRSVVLKPRARGGGHGVRFLHAARPREEALKTIADLRVSLARLSERGRNTFPYIVSELLDALPVRAQGHPLEGHRYELRIVVYRSGVFLRAFPSACKVAGARFDPSAPTHEMLLNTVSSSTQQLSEGPSPFVLPLSSPDTLAALGLSAESLEGLCDAAVRFVAFLTGDPS